MALPRPTPPAPTGRVSPDQLRQDLSTEQEAYDSLAAAQNELDTNASTLKTLQEEATGLFTDLFTTTLPDQVKSCTDLTTAIATGAPSNTILDAWRKACRDTKAVLLSVSGIGSQLADIDDQAENVELSAQALESAKGYAQTTTDVVNKDLLNLNLTPPGP